MRKVASRHTHKCLIVYFNSLLQAYFSTVAHMYYCQAACQANLATQLDRKPLSVLAEQRLIAVIIRSKETWSC